jgi:hypothetical protein
MNADPFFPDVPNRARHGACHGTGTASPWEDIAPTVGTPADWRDRIVAPQGEGHPERSHPVWAATVRVFLALGWSLGRLPEVLVRGALGSVRTVLLLAAVIALPVLMTPFVGYAISGFLVRTVLVLGVVLFVTAVTVLAYMILRSQYDRARLAMARTGTSPDQEEQS